MIHLSQEPTVNQALLIAGLTARLPALLEELIKGQLRRVKLNEHSEKLSTSFDVRWK